MLTHCFFYICSYLLVGLFFQLGAFLHIFSFIRFATVFFSHLRLSTLVLLGVSYMFFCLLSPKEYQSIYFIFFNHFKLLRVHSPSFLENGSCRFSLSKIIRHFLSLSDSLYKSRIDLTVFFFLTCLFS